MTTLENKDRPHDGRGGERALDSSADEILRASGLLELGEDPPIEALETALRTLATAVDGEGRLRRATLREGAIRALSAARMKSPARLVDAALAVPDERSDDGRQGQAVVLSDPEPWPEPVDGAELLDELAATYARYVVQPDGAATVEALWTLHSHAHDAVAVSPLLGVTSATKRCGKTTLLTLLGALAPRPLPASNITSAALFRTVEAYRPTLLVDEADTFLRDREDLRGILNAGHHRAGAFVVRTVGEDHEPRVFSTWCPKAVALIGTLPDTIQDRSVVVRLRRRRSDEVVERLRLDRLGELEPLRRRCARWSQDHVEQLRAADPEVPAGLNDRASDNWRCLLAIADLAGGVWPTRAREVARLLSGALEDDDGDAGVLLLGDLHQLYEHRCVDRMSSADIVKALGKMEDRPWPEWKRGQPITARQLARLLRPYGIRPQQLWDPATASKVRGYEREQLADAWARYVPPADPVEPVGSSAGAGDRALGDPVGTPPPTGSRIGDTARNDAILPVLPDRDPGLAADVPDDDYARLEREAIAAEVLDPDLWAGGVTDPDDDGVEPPEAVL